MNPRRKRYRPGPSLALSLPSSAVLGSPTEVTVSVNDSSGKPDATFTGKVSFTNTDESASPLSDYTLVAMDKGVHKFEVTSKTKGSQTLKVDSDELKGTSAAITVK